MHTRVRILRYRKIVQTSSKSLVRSMMVLGFNAPSACRHHLSPGSSWRLSSDKFSTAACCYGWEIWGWRKKWDELWACSLCRVLFAAYACIDPMQSYVVRLPWEPVLSRIPFPFEMRSVTLRRSTRSGPGVLQGTNIVPSLV